MTRNFTEGISETGTGSVTNLRIITFTLLIALLAYIYVSSRGQKKFEHALAEKYNCQPVIPRVPSQWPLALDLLIRQYRMLLGGHTFEQFTEFFAIAGTVRIQLFGVTGYFTSDPENIESILNSRFEDYGMGTRRLAFFPMIGEGIFTQDGPAWKRSRELIRRQFARVQKQNLQVFTPHVKELISGLENESKFAGTVDMKPFFFDYTLSTTTQLLFGEPHGSLSERERDAVRDNFDYAALGVGVRLRLADLAIFYNPSKFRNACKGIKQWASIFAGKAMKYRNEVGDEKASEKYSFIIDMWHELQDEALVRDQLLHILVAGRDSTADLLCWTLFHVVRNRDVLERLKQEVASVPANGIITRQQIQGLRFLRCCLNETLRLYPTLPMNLKFVTNTTILPRGGGIDGQSPVLFPKGTGIALSIYHLHRLESIYGSDAKLYRPERWESGELMKKAGLGKGFVDFNAGPRLCLGKDFALMEASYAVIRILQAFPNIRLPPGVPNEPLGTERQDYTIGLAPADGVKVLLS
ncbi:cytochrome P450 [Tothia fuscella]|uniref:Cytochrome P450 n=1 Tax=Tothia fuscella TaxID=1048955 RepID=A0A9P4NS59_9PEZI|nr:cytochrome P450 [Tothia fuscella]